jgi:hypothetical protein
MEKKTKPKICFYQNKNKKKKTKQFNLYQDNALKFQKFKKNLIEKEQDQDVETSEETVEDGRIYCLQELGFAIQEKIKFKSKSKERKKKI